MKRFAPLVIIALIGVPLCLAVTYGSKWTPGPKYGMPVALLADDRHFADGAPLDALTAAIIRTGYQEEISGGIVGTFAGGMAWVIHQWGKQPVVTRGRRNARGAVKEAALGLSLDVGLMRWNDRDVLSRRHVLNSVLILGRTGSGKTSGSGMALGRAIVADPLSSLLILAAKPEDAHMWRNIFRERGRPLLEFSPEGNLRCCMIDFIQRCGADTREVVDFLLVSAEVLRGENKGGGEYGSFFQDEERRYLYHAVEILRQAGVAVSVPNLQRFISDAALSVEQRNSDAWRDGFHNACLRRAAERKKSPREKHDFELAVAAWGKDWVVMAPRTRSSVLATLLNTCFYFNAGIARELISTTTNCSPLDMLQGRSILVNCPSCEYGPSGALISTCWKYLTQKTILARQFKPGDFYNVIWADEAWQIVTSFDQHYIATSRSHGGALCLLAQGRDSFYSALKGENGKHFANGLISQFGHRVVHALGSPEDAEYHSSLLGRRLTTTFGGSMHPSQDAFDALWGNAQCHTSFNEHMENILEPRVFLSGLRCGGSENQGRVDAIVIRSGEPFSTGENYLFTTFKQ